MNFEKQLQELYLEEIKKCKTIDDVKKIEETLFKFAMATLISIENISGEILEKKVIVLGEDEFTLLRTNEIDEYNEDESAFIN